MDDRIETTTNEKTGQAGHDSMAYIPADQPQPVPVRQVVAEEFRPPYIYAIGHVEPRFTNLAVEREYAQVVGRYDTQGKTEQECLQLVLADRENRYLARHMCWLFSVERLPTYLLVPRDPVDIERLIEGVRPSAQPTDLEVVVGVRGPMAPPEVCDGLVLPIVAFDQLYSFQREDLIGAIPMPADATEEDEEQFRQSAGELFDRFMQIADNAGSTDEHRALNYLSVRYPAVYANAVAAHRAEKTLTAVEVRPSRLSSTQSVLSVIFSYTHRRTDVTDKWFVRVNVSGEFPFLVTKLQPFYER
ncbi:MAG: hypothetical protein ABI047_07620 [Jatrophihabitantaceae bacterium]